MEYQISKGRASYDAPNRNIFTNNDWHGGGIRAPQTSERLCLHFLHDPRPKFILKPDGIILNANISALGLIEKNVFHTRASGELGYGSSGLDNSVRRILKDLKSGRIRCKRLLKRLVNDDWMSLDFHRVDSFDCLEIVLTINEGGFCPSEGLDAFAVAFDLTVTEAKVVEHISNASCPKEISTLMGISVNTVRSHLRSIYSKTGARGYNRVLRLILLLQAS